MKTLVKIILDKDTILMDGDIKGLDQNKLMWLVAMLEHIKFEVLLTIQKRKSNN